MKAIVLVTLVLSKNRAEGLVRPAYRVDGAAVRGTHQHFKRPSRGVTPRGKTARPGPSPAGEWMICGSRGIARTSRTSFRTATRPASDHPPRPRADPRLGGQRGFQAVSIPASARRSPNRPKPQNPRHQRRSARALCRTRPDDPFLTMEDQGSNKGVLGPLSPQIADL
jgi:hypothetical protein